MRDVEPRISPQIRHSGSNNPTPMIEVPEGNRLELRLSEDAVNPYLTSVVRTFGITGVVN